jgi:hypothetical protein
MRATQKQGQNELECDWPLYLAVFKGYLDVIALPLQAGARLDWQDANGRDVLWLARATGQKYVRYRTDQADIGAHTSS